MLKSDTFLTLLLEEKIAEMSVFWIYIGERNITGKQVRISNSYSFDFIFAYNAKSVSQQTEVKVFTWVNWQLQMIPPAVAAMHGSHSQVQCGNKTSFGRFGN